MTAIRTTPLKHWPLALVLAVLLSCTIHDARATSAIQTSGDILQFVLPGVAAGLTLGERDWDGAREFAESAALTLGATYTLKYTVNERRPNGGGQSFPSAHTSISFSAAEYLRKRYGLEWGVPAYGLASWVAYSRVESNQHHPQDVIAGASIGIVSSYLFTKPYKGWQIEFTGEGKFYGFRITREF